MSLPKERRGFFNKLSKNLAHVDKETLLLQLMSESENQAGWLRILEYLDEGILIVCSAGAIKFSNSAAEKMLGVSPNSNKPFWSNLEDTDLKEFFTNQFLILSSEVSQTLKVLVPLERTIKIYIHPHLSKISDQHLIRLVDLTSPMLPEVERMARNRLESIIRLAGGLAHEIGNPLNALSLHSEILKKQLAKLKSPEKEKIQETLAIIQDEIRRLDQIVRGFLKTTRRAPLRFQMLNLSALITDVLRVLKPSLQEHDIRLELELPEKIEFFIDEERIRSMLINLIQNAMEAMKEGGVLGIRVQTHRQTVKIQIQDSGKGILPEDLPHIFEAYFTTKDHGSGLGLLFVYDAIMDHGGKIQVDSKRGAGTRFEILLPLRRSNLQINHDQQSK